MLGDNMDLSNYSQKDCINGLTKEDAQKVKEIPEIEESIDGINSHITNISSDIEDLQVASISFADHFDTLDSKVSNLESGLSDLDDEITEINNVTIANISTQVNTIQNSTIPALDARIGTIENSAIPDINSDISDINDAIDTINNTTIPDLQTDIEDEIELINDAIDGLDERITDIENGSGEWSYVTRMTDSNLYNKGLFSLNSGIIKVEKDIVIDFKIEGDIHTFILPKGIELNASANIFNLRYFNTSSNFNTSHEFEKLHYYCSYSSFCSRWSTNWTYSKNVVKVNMDNYTDGSGTTTSPAFGLTTSPLSSSSGSGSITIRYKN